MMCQLCQSRRILCINEELSFPPNIKVTLAVHTTKYNCMLPKAVFGTILHVLLLLESSKTSK